MWYDNDFPWYKIIYIFLLIGVFIIGVYAATREQNRKSDEISISPEYTITISAQDVQMNSLVESFNADRESIDSSLSEIRQDFIDAILSGDDSKGLSTQSVIYSLYDKGECVNTVDYIDLLWLSKIIYAEAGSDWIPEWVKYGIGEVVMNRVSSPDYPDTIIGVLIQRAAGTQYQPVHVEGWDALIPSQQCIEIAWDILYAGFRIFDDPDIIYSSQYILGDIAFEYTDTILETTTYFCKGE
jgi:hypothetical protein